MIEINYLQDWRKCYSPVADDGFAINNPNTPFLVRDEHGDPIPLDQVTREQISKYMPHYLDEYDRRHREQT